MPLLLHDPAARSIVIAAVAVVAVGELVPTYLGQARDGQRRPWGSVAESLLLRRRKGAAAQDRGTKWIIVSASRVGLIAALAIAVLAPSLRAYANNWWTLGLGLTLALAGVALRGWAILTLGRYFRREVTIEPGQAIIRRGPYRLLRHPSYAGLLLIYGGFGLALGSWVSAAVAALIMFAGMLPRIRVEEQALERAFGPDYLSYANATARIIPYVW